MSELTAEERVEVIIVTIPGYKQARQIVDAAKPAID
jgi:hypothetical protein